MYVRNTGNGAKNNGKNKQVGALLPDYMVIHTYCTFCLPTFKPCSLPLISLKTDYKRYTT